MLVCFISHFKVSQQAKNDAAFFYGSEKLSVEGDNMNNLIFDYSSVITESHEYSLKGEIKNIIRTNHSLPKNYNIFFNKTGVCPSCKKEAKIIFEDSKSFILGKDYFSTLTIWECEFCGWWESRERSDEEYDLIDEVNAYRSEFLTHSIIKSFKVDDKNLPVQALVLELEKRKDLLYDINPYKMEELVQHVFSSFYNCEVQHVGRTGDGGKDLIIVNSDEPILVQVKRRSKKQDVELVSTIRDFLGTMFIENSRKGIVVSTADHFSKGSKKTIEELLDERRLEFFELIDFKRFCNMLNVIKKDNFKPWYNKIEIWNGNTK